MKPIRLSLFSFLIALLCFSSVDAQSNRQWWNSLSPTWKQIFMDEIGLEEMPTNEQLIEISWLDRLNCSKNDEITTLKPLAHLKKLEELNCSHCKNLKTLEGLNDLKMLKSLNCSYNPNINSLIPLKNVVSLERLWSNETMVISLRPIQDHKKLKMLRAENCLIRKLDPLKKLTQLEFLDVSGNENIYELDPLENLVNLKVLKVNNTQINDLRPLANVLMLRQLEFSKCRIPTLLPLQSHNNLEILDCSYNRNIDTLKPVMGLGKLVKLRINGTNIQTDEIISFRKKHPDCDVKTTK